MVDSKWYVWWYWKQCQNPIALPEAYQFQNFPDVNLRPLLAYNFVTSIPSLNQTATIDGVLTWLNSTHQDEAPDQLSPIEGHTGISGVGSIAYFGTFNGSLFSGYNGVPVAILSNFTFPISDSSSKFRALLNMFENRM